MKRTDNILNRLLYLVAAAGLLVFALSCQREDLGPVGETCTLTYKVELPLEFDTKAAAAYEGDVDQLIYEVHYKNAEGNYIKLYQQKADIQNGSVELPVELVRDQDYMVLFWAQVEDSGAYNTADLTSVTFSRDAYTDVKAGDFEAFFGSDHVTDGTISENGGNIGLIRAVSQLNIATESLNDQTISKVDVTVGGISKIFNVMDGDCGEVNANTSVTISYQPDASTSLGEFNSKPLVFSNFVGFTPIDQTTRVNVNFTVTTTDGASATQEASGVPVKPNYKSNITGDFVPALPAGTIVTTWDELNAAVENSSVSIVNLDNKTFESNNTLSVTNAQTIKNGTLNCNVNALNTQAKTFSNIVFGGKFYYNAGDLKVTNCTFNGEVKIYSSSNVNEKINFTNCNFNNNIPTIELSGNYPITNLSFSGTTNLSTLTIKTYRSEELTRKAESHLGLLLAGNSFTSIKCICTDGEIEIK